MKLFLTSLLLISALHLCADPGREVRTIRGRVVESGTGEALTGVQVAIPGTDVFVYTDRDGYFEIQNCPLNAELRFRLVSFETASASAAEIGSETAAQIELMPR